MESGQWFKNFYYTVTPYPSPLDACKGKFWYNAVSNPQDDSKRFTLYFPGRPVQSDTMDGKDRTISCN